MPSAGPFIWAGLLRMATASTPYSTPTITRDPSNPSLAFTLLVFVMALPVIGVLFAGYRWQTTGAPKIRRYWLNWPVLALFLIFVIVEFLTLRHFHTPIVWPLIFQIPRYFDCTFGCVYLTWILVYFISLYLLAVGAVASVRWTR